MTIDNYNIKRLSIISDTKGEYSVAKGATFDYYEDILSPTISCSVTFPDTDGVASKWPIVGGEKIVAQIFFPYSGDTFTINENHKIINAVPGDEITKSSGQIISLNGVSTECLKNEGVRLCKKYQGNVGEIVQELLMGSASGGSNPTSIGTSKRLDSENTTNSYSFIGNQRRAFDTIQWLCPKSMKGQTSGGFLFFETLDGYVYKSVDTLFKQSPVAAYTKTEIVKPGDRFVIFNEYLTKSADLPGMSRMGMYSNRTIYYNSKDMKPDLAKGSDLYNVTNANEISTKAPTLPEGLEQIPTRTMMRFLDPGATQNGETLDEVQDLNELAKYQNQTYIRLNLLFSQSLNIIIPMNPKLRAGQVISVKFPLPTSDQTRKKFGSSSTKDVSGNYLISQLRHSVYDNRAYTSLKLIRDSFKA
jgi:hypothetical protein